MPYLNCTESSSSWQQSPERIQKIVHYFEKRFPWDYFYCGAKKKTEILREIRAKEQLKPEEICYIGDGKYDVEPLEYAA